ncbi:MAG: type II toxin-antitoxin system RelE/ParE family toxin [Bacteroidota bacterium]
MKWSRTLAWTVKWVDAAVKEYKKLGKPAQVRIRDYLIERIAKADNPRQFGKALSGNLSGLWRYRVSNYRIVCRIDDDELVVLVLRVAHRSRVYEKS